MKHNTAPIRWNTWSENWIEALSGVLLRINRAAESSKRGVCLCACPYPYLLGFMMRLLSFHSADRQDFLYLSLSCQLLCFCRAASAFGGSVLAPCAKGWHWNLCFSVTARMRVRNWGCWVQHLTLLSRPFILRGTSSEEMELKVKIPFFVLAAEAQLSSFLSYCLTFCLCLCYRNRASSLCVQVFCSLQLLNDNQVRFEACTGISSVPASFGDPCQVEVVCLPSCSDCLP